MVDFIEVLRISLDANLDPQVLKDFAERTRHNPTMEEMFDYATETLDKPLTYINLCYYLAQFFESFVMHTKDEFKNQIWDDVIRYNITAQSLREVQTFYKSTFPDPD